MSGAYAIDARTRCLHRTENNYQWDYLCTGLGVCAVFSEREAKLVGTSDFVVTRGYVQIRVVGFPWETASLEAVVRCQDGALLLRRERAETRLWVYRQQHHQHPSDRYAIRTRNLRI